jgi:phenylpropionate dioxygenase-like ring-hydroxylating dioxygenase large terminal subunit
MVFQNICTHYFKRIQTEESGNRSLLCEYHGWNYNKEGIPRLPERNAFNETELFC